MIVGLFVGWMFVEFGVDVIKVELFGVGDLLCKWWLLYDGMLVWWVV